MHVVERGNTKDTTHMRHTPHTPTLHHLHIATPLKPRVVQKRRITLRRRVQLIFVGPRYAWRSENTSSYKNRLRHFPMRMLVL